MQHPNHTALTNLIQSWYTRSDDSLDLQVEARSYGFYTRHKSSLQPGNVHLIEPLAQKHLPDFLKDIKQYFQQRAVRIFIHSRQIDAEIGQQLRQAGCQRGTESIYLAHVGALPRVEPVPNLQIEPVSSENILDYQLTKLKAFADSEAQPPTHDIEAGLALRHSELKGGVQFWIGRLAGEAAAIISWYPGSDRLLLHLGTRIPFRKGGIAKHLLCYALNDAYRQGCQSVMLFTDPEDTPIQLYQRLGFTDPVYWMVQYQYQPKASAP